jgi:hypothetical protein
MANTTVRALGIIATAGFLTAGCLQKEMSETWYLEPEGPVSWVVQETDVRSDAQAVSDRQNEEGSYLAAVQRQDHPVARAFKEMGFIDVRTRFLRANVPFIVVTDAKAGRIDALGQRIITRLGLAGTSVLVREGDFWQWTMTMRDPHAPDGVSPTEDMQALMNGIGGLKVVLVSGRFDEAAGFTLGSDHRVATLEDPEKQAGNHQDDDPTIVLRLKWR